MAGVTAKTRMPLHRSLAVYPLWSCRDGPPRIRCIRTPVSRVGRRIRCRGRSARHMRLRRLHDIEPLCGQRKRSIRSLQPHGQVQEQAACPLSALRQASARIRPIPRPRARCRVMADGHLTIRLRSTISGNTTSNTPGTMRVWLLLRVSLARA